MNPTRFEFENPNAHSCDHTCKLDPDLNKSRIQPDSDFENTDGYSCGHTCKLDPDLKKSRIQPKLDFKNPDARSSTANEGTQMKGR
jgi:hypothetical protein